MSKNIFYKDCCDKFVDYMKKSHITTQNEPKSEKATQDVQKNCLSLTEQWKKGELKEGEYYVKLESGKIDIYFMVYDDDDCDEIVEIIAEVPSYEEYSRLEWYAGCGPDRIVELNKENRQLRKWCEEFNALKVVEENAKLKELLKEWVKFYPIILYEHEDTLKTKDIIELREKTVEVLK